MKRTPVVTWLTMAAVLFSMGAGLTFGTAAQANLGDGVVLGDSLIFGDGVVLGDVQAMALRAMIYGDPGSAMPALR